MPAYNLRFELSKQQELIAFQMAQANDKTVQEIIEGIAISEIESRMNQWVADRVDFERKRLGNAEILNRITAGE